LRFHTATCANTFNKRCVYRVAVGVETDPKTAAISAMRNPRVPNAPAATAVLGCLTQKQQKTIQPTSGKSKEANDMAAMRMVGVASAADVSGPPTRLACRIERS
jgi:hypothetical protein